MLLSFFFKMAAVHTSASASGDYCRAATMVAVGCSSRICKNPCLPLQAWPQRNALDKPPANSIRKFHGLLHGPAKKLNSGCDEHPDSSWTRHHSLRNSGKAPERLFGVSPGAEGQSFAVPGKGQGHLCTKRQKAPSLDQAKAKAAGPLRSVHEPHKVSRGAQWLVTTHSASEVHDARATQTISESS